MRGHDPVFPRVGVVGGGIMGAGIAEVCARRGYEVVVRELDHRRADAAERRIIASLDRAVLRGKLKTSERDDALARLRVTEDLEALAGHELVIEAVPENTELKVDVFAQLDEVADDEAVLASNTSSIPIMKLAAATSRPHRVIGMHFFNPVPVLPLVELVPTLQTGNAVIERSRRFLEGGLGKTVIHAADRAGFVVNALLIPYILAAIRMFESGFATKEDIDQGMVAGANHPMGPLALADLIGLDTLQSVAESMYADSRDPACVPPALLARMVEAGMLGRKVGQGFYTYGS
jgi:3-hydroxybutyryl-CoA dehydrogenase